MLNRNLWLAWVLVNTLSWAIGFALLTPLDTVIRWSSGLTALHVVFSVLLGAIIGIGQWVVLRRRIEQAQYWILASAIGIGIALPLSNRVAVGQYVVTGQLLANLVFGSVFGLAQWITVQRQLRGTILWMAGTVIGWSAGIGVTMLVQISWRIMELYAFYGFGQILVPIADGLTNGIVVGVVYGVITGTLLIWLLGDVHRTGEFSSVPGT